MKFYLWKAFQGFILLLQTMETKLFWRVICVHQLLSEDGSYVRALVLFKKHSTRKLPSKGLKVWKDEFNREFFMELNQRKSKES